MSAAYQPLPMAQWGQNGRSGHALAGSDVFRFSDIARHEPDGSVTVMSADAPVDVLDRLRRPRADIAGLCMTRPRIMGILNVTPDSFSDGGAHFDNDAAIERARAMAVDADILDIGGESTRPGADTVEIDAEIARVVPVISALRAAGITTPISIDTRKAPVAAAALDAGANIVNDVSAMLYDPDMAAMVAARDVPICLMHSVGDPKTMQSLARYDNVALEVFAHLAARIEAAQLAGIRPDNIIADPGIGFGKTLQHNVTILRALSLYHDLGVPLLLGASRKKFIGTLGQAPEAADRMAGSVAVALHGASMGAQILRVHDTKETRQALALHLAVNDND